MKKTKVVFFLLGLLINSGYGQRTTSQEYPYLHHVTSRCYINKDANQSMYYYSYSLTNDAVNFGYMSAIKIDVSRMYAAVVYDTVGLRFKSKHNEETNRRGFAQYGDAIIPVGFPALPPF